MTEMCSITYNNEFWTQLEREMNQKLPELIKYILAITGFESELALRTVTSEDISNIESCIDKNKMLWMRKYSDVYGNNSKKSTFKLLPGHAKVIFGISEHLKKRAIIASEPDQKIGDRAEEEAGCEYVSFHYLKVILLSGCPCEACVLTF